MPGCYAISTRLEAPFHQAKLAVFTPHTIGIYPLRHKLQRLAPSSGADMRKLS